MADDTLEDRIAALEAKTEALEQQGQAKLAMSETRVATTPSMGALIHCLDRHGIRVQPEDEAEAVGSGSERWGSGETWAESHDDAGGPV